MAQTDKDDLSNSGHLADIANRLPDGWNDTADVEATVDLVGQALDMFAQLPMTPEQRRHLNNAARALAQAAALLADLDAQPPPDPPEEVPSGP